MTRPSGMRILFASLGLLLFAGSPARSAERWPAEKAQTWYADMPWLVGCNYIPRTAINQLEMWQAETFDPQTIDQELGWAEGLGFTSIRVFLHDLLWQQDADGFCRRVDQFLEIADKHHIGVMFVLFDGVWDPNPQLGPQRPPKPHVHNSGWVQSPGRRILGDPARHDELKGYVVGILTCYGKDPRVQVWDLFNEPDNSNRNSYGDRELRNKADMARALLAKTFGWARDVNPVQPLTAGLWHGDWSADDKLSAIDRVMVERSDVISFHAYDDMAGARRKVAMLKRYGRPLLCTEYMARPNRSLFDPQLRYFHDQHIAAYNWGFVNGKSQTIYPWDSWQKSYKAEPPLWHHDIFRADGSPYRDDEVEFIKQLTGKQ